MVNDEDTKQANALYIYSHAPAVLYMNVYYCACSISITRNIPAPYSAIMSSGDDLRGGAQLNRPDAGWVGLRKRRHTKRVRRYDDTKL